MDNNSPYLIQPQGGTWTRLSNGQWLHEEPASAWSVPPNDVTSFRPIKTIEQLEDEILDAEFIE